MEKWLMDAIVGALIGGLFVAFGWLVTGHQQKRELREMKKQWKTDVSRQDKQRDEDIVRQKQQRQEDQEMDQKFWAKQELFNKSLAPLDIGVQLNQIANPNFMNELKNYQLFDEAGELIKSGETDFVKIFVNAGWLSKVYVIDSCFNHREIPYVDLSKYYNNAQSFGQNFQPHAETASLVWIEEEGNRIRLFCNRIINFYPELHSEIFYQFYLVEGSDRKCQLFMFGNDEVNDQLLPFVMDRRGIASTVGTIRQEFKFEYQALSKYLIEQGYQLA